MSQRRRFFLAAGAAGLLAGAVGLPAMAAPVLGQPAPAFQTLDADGRTRSLSEFKGKTVVLEWTNEGCPYVQKHYKAKAMQGLQAEATGDGVVWLTVISSAPGEQGYVAGADAKAWRSRNGAASTALLLDPSGTIGRDYDAKTTPHMFVIDKTGKLAFMGGIDDKPTPQPASLNGAKNYVRAALADVKAGRKVAQAATRPYGCIIKYAG